MTSESLIDEKETIRSLVEDLEKRFIGKSKDPSVKKAKVEIRIEQFRKTCGHVGVGCFRGEKGGIVGGRPKGRVMGKDGQVYV